MTRQPCHFHPTLAAHWLCPKCGKTFCPDCILQRDKGGYVVGQKIHMCPSCIFPTEWIGASTIEPFWNRLHKIFTYPLSKWPLILAAILTAGFFGVPYLLGGTLAGNLLLLTLVGILTKYAFAVLKDTVRGRLVPPAITLDTISANFGEVFKILGIFILVGLGVGWLYVRIGALPAFIFLVLAQLSLPAMVMMLVTTGSFFQAVNPYMFLRLVFRIGWSYLLLWFFLSLLGDGPAALAWILAKLFPPTVVLPVLVFSLNLYLMIAFHLMGYVILQYHREIGYEIQFEDFTVDAPAKIKAKAGPAAVETQPDPNAPVLEKVGLMLKDGQLDEALVYIQKNTADTGFTNLTLSERYYELLKMKQQTAELPNHGVTHLDLLAAANQKVKSLEVYAECRSLSPEFKPSAGAMFKIAGWLSETGKSKEAVGLFSRLTKEYPDDPLVPKAFFRAAQVLHDRLMEPAKSKKILNGMIQKYPEHDIIPQVKNYLAHI